MPGVRCLSFSNLFPMQGLSLKLTYLAGLSGQQSPEILLSLPQRSRLPVHPTMPIFLGSKWDMEIWTCIPLLIHGNHFINLSLPLSSPIQVILVLRQGTLDEIRQWVKSNVDLTQQRFKTGFHLFGSGNTYCFFFSLSKKNTSGKVLLSCRTQPDMQNQWNSGASWCLLWIYKEKTSRPVPASHPMSC